MRVSWGKTYLSFSNGTLALITALQALDIKGEVITTPFSFVATAHSLWWNNITPVFADIEPDHFNLDPDRVEAAITPQTTAIMPVHVYGNPCQVEKFQALAQKHGLKIIYDACHTFGVKINGIPVLNIGDLSVMSFHGTKVYTTFEGGAIVSHDAAMKERIDHLKNFGFAGETTVVGPGINAKMNELQAAMGLLQLKYVDKAIAKRRNSPILPGTVKRHQRVVVSERYARCKTLLLVFPGADRPEGIRQNAGPGLRIKIKKYNIFSRRYFYPLITEFSPYKGMPSARPENLPVAEITAEQVICLPIYLGLEEKQLSLICNVLKSDVSQVSRNMFRF